MQSVTPCRSLMILRRQKRCCWWLRVLKSSSSGWLGCSKRYKSQAIRPLDRRSPVERKSHPKSQWDRSTSLLCRRNLPPCLPTPHHLKSEESFDPHWSESVESYRLWWIFQQSRGVPCYLSIYPASRFSLLINQCLLWNDLPFVGVNSIY